VSDVIWRRLRYMLSPQWDIYRSIGPHVSGMTVLDVGCGTGFGALQLSRYTPAVDGIDTDPDAIEFAQQSFPHVKFRVEDITGKVRGPDYQAVVMVEVLEHIKDYDLALANVARLLKPGGKLYVTARNANADLRRNDLHLREWRADEFVAALAAHFDTVELFDYSLRNVQDADTRITPMVGVAGVWDVKLDVLATMLGQTVNAAGSPW